MTTALQIEANRRNAQLSTGPSSAEGKEIARANSFKHGLCANPAAGVIEDGTEFDQLQRQLEKHLAPRNPIEAGLVHIVATSLWRLQRATKVDAALSSIAVTAVVPLDDRVRSWIDQINTMFMPVYVEVTDPAKRPSGMAKDRKWYKFTRPYLTRLDEWRGDPNGKIAQDGAAIRAMAIMLKDLTGRLAHPASALNFLSLEAQTLAWLLGESASRYEPADRGPDSDDDDNRFVFPDEQSWRQRTDILIGQARKKEHDSKYRLPPQLECLVEARRVTFRAWNKASNDPATQEQADFHRSAALLPDAATLDRLIRYETHADRSLYKALETLAKLRGATVETVMARMTAQSATGATVEVEGQRTRWTPAER